MFWTPTVIARYRNTWRFAVFIFAHTRFHEFQLCLPTKYIGFEWLQPLVWFGLNTSLTFETHMTLRPDPFAFTALRLSSFLLLSPGHWAFSYFWKPSPNSMPACSWISVAKWIWSHQLHFPTIYIRGYHVVPLQYYPPFIFKKKSGNVDYV